MGLHPNYQLLDYSSVHKTFNLKTTKLYSQNVSQFVLQIQYILVKINKFVNQQESMTIYVEYCKQNQIRTTNKTK